MVAGKGWDFEESWSLEMGSGYEQVCVVEGLEKVEAAVAVVEGEACQVASDTKELGHHTGLTERSHTENTSNIEASLRPCEALGHPSWEGMERNRTSLAVLVEVGWVASEGYLSGHRWRAAGVRCCCSTAGRFDSRLDRSLAENERAEANWAHHYVTGGWKDWDSEVCNYWVAGHPAWRETSMETQCRYG